MKPNLEPRIFKQSEHTTPTKVKVQRAIGFLETDGQKGRKRDVFKFFVVDHTQGYEILKIETPIVD